MNPMTKHTQEQGITYWQHWSFAMGIAYHLFVSVVAFAVHAMLPFISIESRHDLEATSAYLDERNHWIETAHDAQINRTKTSYHDSDSIYNLFTTPFSDT